MSGSAGKVTNAPRVTKGEIVRRYLLDLIEGSMSPHEKLPPERDLAELLSVNRMTVRHTLSKLESEGRIYREQGAGTFVSEPRIAKSLELTSFSEDMRSRGLQAGSRSHLMETQPAGSQIGHILGLSPRADVVHVRRVRTADSAPMCLEDSYIPASLVPGILDVDITGSLYDALDSRFRLRLDRAEQTIRATILDPAEASLLETEPFSAAFDVRRVGIDAHGQRIEYAQSIYRGDRYFYDLTIYRNGGDADEHVRS